MLLVIELGSDVMQNIVCNTKSILFVTVITIPCKTIRKKKNDNKKKVMQKFLEFFYHLTWETPKVSHGTNWKPSIVRFQQLGECTSIRWNATRQECGHRLERSGRSKSTTRLSPRVLRKAGGCFFSCSPVFGEDSHFD